MARDIPAKKRTRRSFPVVGMLVSALLLSAAAIFMFFRNVVFVDVLPAVNEVSSLDSLLANPDAVCYTHNPAYKPPQLVRNHYSAVFNDENDIQLAAAQRNGIEELQSRTGNYEKFGLVPLNSNRYYYIQELKYSVPYLVPAARVMLNTVGKCFQDVLAEKYPDAEYKIVITSVLRTNDDVSRLVRRNRWATENSCHKHGTTVDISYHKFIKVSGPDVTEYEMKEFLAQALAELRDKKICYVKYERRNCFHITLNQLDMDGISIEPPLQTPPQKNNKDEKKAKPAKNYKNKDAERLRRRDGERKKNANQKGGNKNNTNPSPMI